MDKNTYVVIMAGGIGSRFWPLSRHNHPKQFLDLLGIGKSLLQLTFERFSNEYSPDNILVVTSEQYVPLVLEQVPELSRSQILVEPQRKNTAACNLYASLYIKQMDPDANLIITPSDHLIVDPNIFLDTISEGVDFVNQNKDSLLTLGINPTRPDTGYGYIQYLDSNEPIKKVKTFAEKPNLEIAKKFLESGDFLWNSGIFLWNVNAIIKAFEEFLPDMYNQFSEINFSQYDFEDQLKEAYSLTQNISIDYGILEKSEQVYVLPSFFSWTDLGNWNGLYDVHSKDENNNVVISKESMLKNSTNNMVYNDNKDKLVVLESIQDLIIVNTEDVLLVCNRSQEQKVKEIVGSLVTKQMDRFL